MGLKQNYDVVDAQGFDKTSLHPGEIACTVTGFREGQGNAGPVINLKLELAWAANEADQEHIGKSFDHGVFFGGPNGALTVRQLKQFAKDSGFAIDQWTPDNSMPLGTMIPGFLKLLAYKNLTISCSIKAGKPSAERKTAGVFLNFGKVLRAAPDTGEAYPDHNSLPDAPVPHELILEAVEAVLEGEKEETPF